MHDETFAYVILGIVIFAFLFNTGSMLWMSRKEAKAEEEWSERLRTQRVAISVSDHLGGLLVVTPKEDWKDSAGWVVADSNSPYVPLPFSMRFLRVMRFGYRGYGGLGRIEETKHPQNGQFVAFVPNLIPNWDFATFVGPYSIVIGAKEPLETKNFWDCMSPETSILAGFGEVIPIEHSTTQD